MQAEGDIDFVHACAAAEARALSLWILECVDASSRPFWERELAGVRALI